MKKDILKRAKLQPNNLSRIIDSTKRIIERDTKILKRTKGQAHQHAYEFILNNWSTIDLLVLCAQNPGLENGTPKITDSDLNKALRNSIAYEIVKLVRTGQSSDDKTAGKLNVALEGNQSRLNKDTRDKIKDIKADVLRMSFVERFIKASSIKISTTNINNDVNRYTMQILIEHEIKTQIDNVCTFDYLNAVKSIDLFKRTSLLTDDQSFDYNFKHKIDNAPKPKRLTLN